MQEDLQKDWEKSYFMDDATFFFWWVFSRKDFLPEQDDYFWLRSVLPWSTYSGSKFFRYLAQHIDIDKRFDVWFYADSGIDAKIPKTKEEIAKYSKEEQKIIWQINKKLWANKCLNAEGVIFVKEVLGISIGEHIYFRPDPSAIHNDVWLKEKLDNYIKEFLAGELLVYDKNYFNFEKQKQIFIQKIRKMKAFEDFGQNFIVNSKLDTIVASKTENIYFVTDADKSQVLFVHTLYALEFLWYIEILKIWFRGDGLNVQYFANILPNESFKELVYDDYRKYNPSILVLWFDAKTDTLNFWKKKIQFSKGKKETDAVMLIRSLIKQKNTDYLNEDEILEEWGYRTPEEQKKTAKNKVYNACLKIQTTMKLEADIDDFLEHNTSKFRINPKYRPVDK